MPYDLDIIFEQLRNGTLDEEAIKLLPEKEQYALCERLLDESIETIRYLHTAIDRLDASMAETDRTLSRIKDRQDIELAILEAKVSGWYKDSGTDQ
jgi:hypothetical protein